MTTEGAGQHIRQIQDPNAFEGFRHTQSPDRSARQNGISHNRMMSKNTLIVNRAKERMMAEAKGVEAVERSLQILNCFAQGQKSLTLADIARETGLYKSTILRIIISLERFRYLCRSEDGRYRLGHAVGHLSASYRQAFDLDTIVRPVLEQLSKVTGETASFYRLEGEMRVCLYRSEPDRSIRHTIREGVSMSLDHGASSKVLKAWSMLDDDTLAPIRSAGFAISRGERDPEVGAIAVPLCSIDGTLVGALNVSGPLSRFTDAKLDEMLHALQAEQSRLGQQLDG